MYREPGTGDPFRRAGIKKSVGVGKRFVRARFLFCCSTARGFSYLEIICRRERERVSAICIIYTHTHLYVYIYIVYEIRCDLPVVIRSVSTCGGLFLSRALSAPRVKGFRNLEWGERSNPRGLADRRKEYALSLSTVCESRDSFVGEARERERGK